MKATLRRRAGGSCRFASRRPGRAIEVPVKPRVAVRFDSGHEVGVPDSAGPMDVKITATSAGRTKTTTVRVAAGAEVAGVRGRQCAHRHRLHRYPAEMRRAARREHRRGDRISSTAIPISAGTWKLPGRRRTTSTAAAAQRLADFYRWRGRASSAFRPFIATCSPACARPRRPAGLTWFAHQLCRRTGHSLPQRDDQRRAQAGGFAADDPGRRGHPLFQQRRSTTTVPITFVAHAGRSAPAGGKGPTAAAC